MRDRWFTGYALKVGSIDVAISVDGNAFTTLASFDDFRAHDMVTVTNFTVAVKVPAVVTQHAVLRVRYISNNPLEIDPANNTAAVFYNCADINITDSDDAVTPSPFPAPLSTTRRSPPPTSSAPSFSCQPTPLFHATGETLSRAGTVLHEIWYATAPFLHFVFCNI